MEERERAESEGRICVLEAGMELRYTVDKRLHGRGGGVGFRDRVRKPEGLAKAYLGSGQHQRERDREKKKEKLYLSCLLLQEGWQTPPDLTLAPGDCTGKSGIWEGKRTGSH